MGIEFDDAVDCTVRRDLDKRHLQEEVDSVRNSSNVSTIELASVKGEKYNKRVRVLGERKVIQL